MKFEAVHREQQTPVGIIAEWYALEWKMDPEATRMRLSGFPVRGVPLQILMSIGDTPVATGGLYDHVGLLDIEPRFKMYGPWLALVYTPIEHRKLGYGTLLCEEIQRRSKDLGLKELFLFTSTAESLYLRMGWAGMERLNIKGRDIVVMKKDL